MKPVLQRTNSAPQSGSDGENDDFDSFNEDMVPWDVTVAVKSRFDAQHFTKACQVIRALQNPLKKLKRPQFDDDQERVLTYELTVAILKYSSFLNQALEASDFYKRNTQFSRENNEEILVVLYDLFERDFQLHRDDPFLGKRFGPIQSAIMSVRTKVMAHLARLRIQHQATTVGNLLPENLRHQRHIDQNPLYAWINLKRTKLESVITALTDLGFQRSEFEDDILIQENSYYMDGNHNDLIRFHSHKKDTIFNSSLVKDGLLVVQDKSACVSVYTLVKAIFYKETLYRNKKLNSDGIANLRRESEPQGVATVYLGIPLLFPPHEEWYDNILETSRKEPKPNCVIVTHGGSGRTVAHLACLLQESAPKWLTRSVSTASDRDDLATSISQKFIPRPTLSVIAFGISVSKLEETIKFFRRQLQLTNVKVYAEDFLNVSPKDPRVKGACAILVNPPSTGSALKDPVAYVCTEGGDEDILLHLPKFAASHTGTMADEQMTASAMQLKYLKHAMSFSQVKLCLYTTCSLLPVENTEVVQTAIHDFKNAVLDHKLRVFRDILYQSRNVRSFRECGVEVIQLENILDEYIKSDFNGPFLQLSPSSASSGCFMALLRRKEAVVMVGRLLQDEADDTMSVNGETQGTSTSSTAISGTSRTALDAMEVKVHSAANIGALEAALEKLALASAFSQPEIPTEVSRSQSSTIGPDSFRRNKRRSMTKRAIIQRVSTPTHASMAKRTCKWGDYTRSLNRTGENKGGRGSGFGGGPRGSHHLHDHRQCSHHACICPICARHAKNFPDYRSKQQI